jgi:hypothetical protein
MAVLQILIGIALLIFGRKLFWVFIGGVGFVLGIVVASAFLKDQPGWLVFLVALAAGVLGAVLIQSVQKIALGIAGFIVGGFALTTLVTLLGIHIPLVSWIIFVIGGLIGVALVVLLFEWALIILSTVNGATLIVDALKFSPPITILLFLVLLGVGIAYQGGWLGRKRQGV